MHTQKVINCFPSPIHNRKLSCCQVTKIHSKPCLLNINKTSTIILSCCDWTPKFSKKEISQSKAILP